MAMEPVDVAVLGGGIFGLAAAWACAERGMSVRVHEARRIGAGSSGGVVGALSPHMPEAWSPKKAFQLRALLSAERFWGQVAALGGGDPGYRRCGRVIPLATARAAELARERSVAARELWQEQAAFEVAPARFGISGPHGVVHETLSAQLFPRAALACLAAALRKRGVHIREGSSLDPDDARARHVVIAAGHETAGLVPDLVGRLSGVKGQAALLDHVLPDDFPVVFDDGTYVIGHGPHGTAVGSTSEKTWTSEGPDALLDTVIARARAILPGLDRAQVVERWAGIRPRAARPDPCLGPLRDNLWVFTGGFKIGFGIAHELAHSLAGMIAGEDPPLPGTFHLSAHL